VPKKGWAKTPHQEPRNQITTTIEKKQLEKERKRKKKA
jgi:hypothetical protein